MQSFHTHGDACTRIENEALKLAMRDAPEEPEDEPLKVYQDMLHDLGTFNTIAEYRFQFIHEDNRRAAG